jgi:hypothetical protein
MATRPFDALGSKRRPNSGLAAAAAASGLSFAPPPGFHCVWVAELAF